MEIENYKTINSKFINKENPIVWGSIDPRTGQIDIYPNVISNIIENRFKDFIKNVRDNTVYLPEFYNCSIYFKGNNKYVQTTNNGYRDVFREDIDINIDDKTSDIITIMKSVKYNTFKKAWYLSKSKITHLGIALDISGSMINIYNNIVEQCIEEFIEKQKTINNPVRLTALSFNDKTNILYDNIDLKKERDIKTVFYSQQCKGCTAYYDAFLELIYKIEQTYNFGDEVIICVMTDGLDNKSNHSSIELRDKIISKKKLGWIIVMFGTEEANISETSKKVGISGDCILELGKSNQEQASAYKSLSNGINRVRTGKDKTLSFSNKERFISNKKL